MCPASARPASPPPKKAGNDVDTGVPTLAEGVDREVEEAVDSFVGGILDLAIDDYMEDFVIRRVSAGSEDLTADEDLILDPEDPLEAALVLPPGVYGMMSEEEEEDAVSIISFCVGAEDDDAHDAEETSREALYEKMSMDIVTNTPVAAVEPVSAPVLLPAARGLAPCTRPAFRRRLAPRQPPPMEEPFALDCLPLSAAIALPMPPSAELAALRAAPPGQAYLEVAPPMPFCAATMPKPALRPLSSEAHERLLMSATEGLKALFEVARLEAAVTIQRRWRQTQAASVGTTLGVVQATTTTAKTMEKELAHAYRMDIDDDVEPSTCARREASLANAYAALDAEVFNMADSSDIEAKARIAGARAPRAPPCRPSTAPTAPPGPAPAPGQRGDPRRRMLGARTAATQDSTAGGAAGGVAGARRYEVATIAAAGLVPTPPPPRPTEVVGGLVPHPPSRPPPSVHGAGRRPLGIDAAATLKVPAAAMACAEGALVASGPPLFASPRRPTTPRVSRAPLVRTTATPFDAGAALGGPPAAVAARPTAAELDLGLLTMTLSSASSVSPTTYVVEKPTRVSKVVGTGLLPRLTTKVTKNVADTILWTVPTGRAAAPRDWISGQIDTTAMF